MDVNPDTEPSEGEVLVMTTVGGFVVKGTLPDVSRRLTEEEWAHFELAESGDRVVIRGVQVAALRAGTKARKSGIGFLGRTQSSSS